MLSIFQNEYIIVDYANVPQEDVISTLEKGYNVGFTSDDVIAYTTMENGELYIVSMSEDGGSFSKVHYNERFIKNLYKNYDLKAIVGFKVFKCNLDKHLEDDKMYLICKSLIDVRCTFCNDTTCEHHRNKNLN